MCLVNKILIGLVVIAVGACMYFSAITLKTHSFWGNEYNQQAKQLKTLEEEAHVYQYGLGIPDTEGYKRSLYEQEKYLRALQDLRGPVYRDCDVRSLFASDHTFNVFLPGVTEVQLPVNTPLYVFRPTKNDQGKMEYLGRFLVKGFGVDPDTAQAFVKVEPTRAAYEKNERMTSLLAERPGFWTIFLNMPIDKAEHGSENEDYIPFETQIQYYADQEYIMQELKAKQQKHIDYMVSIIGDGAEQGEAAMKPIASFLSGEVKLISKDDSYRVNIQKLYKDYSDENQAMQAANQALKDRVGELERKKAGYQESINRRVKPINPLSNR